MEHNGIDVSGFQGYINWSNIKENDVKFAMLRATYGKEGIDNRFKENITNIQKTKILPGVYHSCYATSENEALEEVKHFINTISPYEIKYPAAVDMENSNTKDLEKEKITEIIKIFIDFIKKSGYHPMIYTNENQIDNLIDLNKFSKVDLWISKWNSPPPTNKNLGIWQKSNLGKIPEIGDHINLDISYKNYESITNSKTNEYYIHKENKNQKNSSENKFIENDSIEYVVKPEDTLWIISQRFLGDGRKYREIMNTNSFTGNEIYPGQKIKIPCNSSFDWKLYKVERGETLREIAEKFLKNPERYFEIKKANNLINDMIYAGQILKIPKD